MRGSDMLEHLLCAGLRTLQISFHGLAPQSMSLDSNKIRPSPYLHVVSGSLQWAPVGSSVLAT